MSLVGETSTVIPPAPQLRGLVPPVGSDQRQAAVDWLAGRGYVKTKPGGGTFIAKGWTIRQVYDLIYAGASPSETPAPLPETPSTELAEEPERSF